MCYNIYHNHNVPVENTSTLTPIIFEQLSILLELNRKEFKINIEEVYLTIAIGNHNFLFDFFNSSRVERRNKYFFFQISTAAFCLYAKQNCI